MEDNLPSVYEAATGETYPGGRIDDTLVMGAAEIDILRELCGSDNLHFQLTRELLSIEKRHKSMLRRAGLFEAVEQAFYRNFYDNEEDAVARARQHRDALDDAQERGSEERLPMIQKALDLPAGEDGR